MCLVFVCFIVSLIVLLCSSKKEELPFFCSFYTSTKFLDNDVLIDDVVNEETFKLI